MPTEAHVTPIWKKQKLFIAIFFIGFGLYFFWDGAIGYPAADRRYHEWKKYNDAGTLADWPAVAQEHGWKSDEWKAWLNDPHQQGRVPADYHGHAKIVEQFACGGFALVLGLIVLTYWLTQKGRVLRTDEAAVYSPAGTRIPFDAITGLGKKKWENKGYATVRYKINGREGRFLLDDYKFDRDATHAILAEIEEKLIAGAKK
ncbi:MAG: hypothetical protein ABJF10_18500 [Chthoniobacter sp.]|uniref:hypothetical protein n=1 Tax=Chthoniobacter sp. TaxID=2510640 RepID=UPI0032A82D90